MNLGARRSYQRYTELKACTATKSLVDFHCSTMKFDKFFHNRQPQSGPSNLLGQARVSLLEALEDLLTQFRLDSRTSILDRDTTQIMLRRDNTVDATT